MYWDHRQESWSLLIYNQEIPIRLYDQGFVVKVIYADQAFESCKTELNEQGITLLCYDTNSHVHCIEQGIKFVKERVKVCEVYASKGNKMYTHTIDEGVSCLNCEDDQLD